MKLTISNRARGVIASPMRKFLPLMRSAEDRGIKIFKLNIGEPDAPAPGEFLRRIRPPKGGRIGYAPSSGLPSYIEAWQAYYRAMGLEVPAEGIVPTIGAAEAIMFALLAVADPGDEVIVFEPIYVSFKSFAITAGIKLVPILQKIENGFAMPSVAVIEGKVTKKTRAIVIVNPDNPTGKLWRESEIGALVAIAKKHNLFIISDETYREVRFDKRKPFSLLSKKNAREHIIICDSLSKRFSIPGARVGCITSFNRDVMGAVLKFAQARLSTGVIEQTAAIPLLEKGGTYVRQTVLEYERRRNVVVRELKKIPGLRFTPANGAFYQAVGLPISNSEDFVRFMLNTFQVKGKTVAVTPMRDFYLSPGSGEDEVRIAYVLPEAELREAIAIFGKGLEAYRALRK